MRSPCGRDKLGIMGKKMEGLYQTLALSYGNTLTVILERLRLGIVQ